MKKFKQHVSLNSFAFDEANYQAKLEVAFVNFKNDVANYEREVKPSFLVFHYLQEAAIAGKMLSSVLKPVQGPDGWILYFIGDKYHKGLEELPAIVRAAYEHELEMIKEQEKSLLKSQLIAAEDKAKRDALDKAEDKKLKAINERVEKFFS